MSKNAKTLGILILLVVWLWFGWQLHGELLVGWGVLTLVSPIYLLYNQQINRLRESQREEEVRQRVAQEKSAADKEKESQRQEKQRQREVEDQEKEDIAAKKRRDQRASDEAKFDDYQAKRMMDERQKIFETVFLPTMTALELERSYERQKKEIDRDPTLSEAQKDRLRAVLQQRYRQAADRFKEGSKSIYED